MPIQIKRAYEKPSGADGVRILVDHLWPRGVGKEDLKLDRWTREIAPSNELRQWFQHELAKWPEFRRRFLAELKPKTKELQALVAFARKGTLTLVFAAKDAEHCNAQVLKELIERRLTRKARAKKRNEYGRKVPDC
ncbi:MAG TPA: DUF488 family protein [Candidatus Hydrogenedentes bacterium]|mgnify:CR=1 FL=1|nr:DUF488 family protein [Candidatus Hydrogenedentota bacterium]